MEGFLTCTKGCTHSCLIRSDGAAVPFGSNNAGKCNIAPCEDGLFYTQAATAGHHTVLLRSDGEAIIVGATLQTDARKTNAFEAIPELPEGTIYTQVAAGFYHVVLLRSDGKAFGIDDGHLDDMHKLRCWVQIPDPPPGRKYVQVAAGHAHTLLLLDSGEAVAVGLHHLPACKIPPLPGSVKYKQVAAGHRLSVLLRTDGIAVACGTVTTSGPNPNRCPWSLAGEEDPAKAFGRVPLEIPDPGPGLAYTQISVGVEHATLLRSDGHVVAVGWNAYRQCDLPPPVPDDPYVQVLASGYHTILLRASGSAVGAGRNDCGQVDIPSLSADPAYVDVAASEHNTVLIRSDGRVSAYGGNYHGQCNIPPLLPGEQYTQAACGFGHIVLLKSDGTAVACGTNSQGQCDIPPPEDGITYKQVAALEGCSLLLASDGRLRRCGTGSSLGPALLEEQVAKVRAYRSHVVLIRPDGSAAAYGSNGLGQCDIPALEEDEVYVDAAAGGYHSVLLTSRGRAVAVGSNAFGQCCIPNLENSLTLTYTSVGAGQKVTILGCSDGSMVSCGKYGDQEHDLPRPPEGVVYTRATAGAFHAALLRSDGCATHVPTGDVLVLKQWSKAAGDGVPKKYVPNQAFNPVSRRICQLQLAKSPGGDLRAQLMSVSGEPITEIDVEATCTMHALSALVDQKLNEACQLVLWGGRSVQQVPQMTIGDAMLELGLDAEPRHGYA